MLFEDSIELDLDEYSPNSEPMPVNWNLKLSQIWLPKHLLPNRETPIDTNRDKPAIYHTLERPEVEDRFSVYVNSPNCVQQLSPGVLQFSHLSSWKHSREIISPRELENSNEFQSATDPERRCLSTSQHILPKNLESVGFNSIETELKSRSAEYKLLQANLKEHADEGQNYQCETHAAEDFITREGISVVHESSPDSIADSLEELYYSDEDESLFYPLAKESCKQESTCNDNYLNSSEQINCLDEVNNQSSEKLKEMPRKSQQTGLHKLSELIQRAKLQDFVINTDNPDHNCKDEVTNELDETIAKFPIAYQRPVFEESVRNKPQKGKRNKKKTKKNLPLENLFVDSMDDQAPPNHKFYENLMRQVKSQPCEQLMNINEFPSLNQPKNTSIFDIEQDESETLNLNSFSQTFNYDSEVTCANELHRDIELLKPKSFDSRTTQIIVIDNIPIGITKDHIESIVLGYGELKKLSVQRHGKFQRAKLEMDFTCDVDWIVDCLNDSEPFGTVGGKTLKCYKLQK